MARRTVLLVLSVVVVIVAAYLAYVQSTLKNSLLFYLPGFINRLTTYTAPYKEVVWQQAPHRSSKRPNIVLIIADDLGINDLNGGAEVATPRIDSIAKNGITFSNAYAGHATCSPSRAALLTGRYGARFGFELTAIPTAMARIISKQPTNASKIQPIFHTEALPKVPHYSKMVVPLSERMLSAVLDDTGDYSTAYVGKWHLGESVGARPQDRGYQESLAFLKGAALYLPLHHPNVITAELPGDNQDDFLRNNLGAYLTFNNESRFEVPVYMTDFLAAEAAKAITAKQHSPYFVTVAFNAPHTPLQATRDDYYSPEVVHIEDHKRRVYAAMIKALDRGVGVVLDAIAATGSDRASNTLVIFTSDNGAPYYLGMAQNNAPYRGGKYSFFEGGLRVPLFMSWPGVAGARNIPAGTVSDEHVGHVDIFSTVAAAAGVDLEELSRDRVYDGRDVLAKLKQQREKAIDFAEHTDKGPQNAAIDPLHESLFWRAGHYHALLKGELKLHASQRPDALWLFNLANDPTERSNLLAGLRWSSLNASLAESGLDNCIRLLQGAGLPALPARSMPAYVAPPGGPSIHARTHQEEAAAAAAATPSALPATQPMVGASEACALARRLLDVSAEQSEPIWPPLLEFPIGIDGHASAVDMGRGAEYIYWAN